MLRNEEKLKRSSDYLEITGKKMVEETQRINLERFRDVNGLVGSWVHSVVVPFFVIGNDFKGIGDFEEALR